MSILHSSKRHTPSGKSKTSLQTKCKERQHRNAANANANAGRHQHSFLLFANTTRYYSLQYGHAQLFALLYAASSSPHPPADTPRRFARARLPP